MLVSKSFCAAPWHVFVMVCYASIFCQLAFWLDIVSFHVIICRSNVCFCIAPFRISDRKYSMYWIFMIGAFLRADSVTLNTPHTKGQSDKIIFRTEVLNSSPRTPRSAYFAYLSLLTHLIQIISLLEVCSVHDLCSDWHAPYTGSIAPYTGSIAPYTGSIAPYTGSIAPYTGSIAPYTGSIAPYTGSIAPYTGSIAPYTGSIAPYTGSIAPYTVSIAPYTGSIAPYTGSIAPYTGSIAPYTGSMLPTPWAGEIRWSLLHFGTFIHVFALCNIFMHGWVWHHIPL